MSNAGPVSAVSKEVKTEAKMGEAKWFPPAFLAKIWPVPTAKITVITVQFLSVDSVQFKHLWIAILEDAYIAKKNLQGKLKYISWKTEEKSRENKADEFKKHFLWIPTNCSNVVCGQCSIQAPLNCYSRRCLKQNYKKEKLKHCEKTEEKSRENIWYSEFTIFFSKIQQTNSPQIWFHQNWPQNRPNHLLDLILFETVVCRCDELSSSLAWLEIVFW